MTKTQKTSRKSKPIRLDKDEKITVGVDVHSKTYHVTIWAQPTDRLVTLWSQPADPIALTKKLIRHRSQIERVIYEAGPTGFKLARTLDAHEPEVMVVSPSHTPQSRADHPKCDRLDSRKLAEYGSKNLLKAIRIPTFEQEADRQILRARGHAVKNQRRVKQQIKSFLLCHGLEQARGPALLGTARDRSLTEAETGRRATVSPGPAAR